MNPPDNLFDLFVETSSDVQNRHFYRWEIPNAGLRGLFVEVERLDADSYVEALRQLVFGAVRTTRRPSAEPYARVTGEGAEHYKCAHIEADVFLSLEPPELVD